ncbi:MAG: glycosyltransferase [Flavobacteriaceae bacterium]
MLLLYLFLAVVLINTAYFILFSKFSMSVPSEVHSREQYPVSVIICAKNEAENLKKNVPLILAQDYSNFEVILINDASVDDTQDVIEAFAKEDPRVHTVTIENNEAFWSNKKYSLTLGIKRAVHQRMLFTDADCQPASNQWIREMTAHFSEEKQLVLGYGAYHKEKGVLNKLIRFETAMTALQYFSYAKVGIPYMGVGRNLAYTNKLFYDNRGFMSHMQIASGDDDLFVNEVATKTNTALCFTEDSFTYSTPKKIFSDWIRQKRRHITTAKYYKNNHQTLLGLYFISNLLFWVLAIASFIFIDWKIPLALTIFRFTLQYIFIGKGIKLLKENDVLPWIPLWELFLVFIQLTIFISNSFSKPKRWK